MAEKFVIIKNKKRLNKKKLKKKKLKKKLKIFILYFAW